MNLFLIIFLAILPCIIAIIITYRLDKEKHKNKKLIAKAFAFGILSALLALVIEFGLSYITINMTGWVLIVISAFIIAGLVEESSKFLLFRLSVWKNKSFNSIVNGILYMVTLSLGFAAIENILYGLSGDLIMIIIRAFTSIPGHAIFSGVMGYFIGKAKVYPEKRKFYILIGLFLGILLHGLYDFLAIGGSYIPIFIIVIIIYIILGLIILYKLIKKALKADIDLQVEDQLI